jgi:hypothetical protein
LWAACAGAVVPALQVGDSADHVARKSLSRLWVMVTRVHSARTFGRPRSEKRRKPRASLIWPKGGSAMALRRAYVALPSGVLSLVAHTLPGARRVGRRRGVWRLRGDALLASDPSLLRLFEQDHPHHASARGILRLHASAHRAVERDDPPARQQRPGMEHAKLRRLGLPIRSPRISSSPTQSRWPRSGWIW